MTRSNENEIQKLEHDDVYDIKKVGLFVPDGDGNLERQEKISIEENQNSLSRYQLADFDCNADPIYMGKVDVDGVWFIKKINMTSENATYVKGDTGYDTNWFNRTSLTYDLFNNVF